MNVPTVSQQPVLWWVIRAVLIVYASIVASNLPENTAALFNHIATRLVAALLIVFLSVYDPASAILLAVGFVVSVQVHNQHHIARMANNAVSTTHHSADAADLTASATLGGKRKEMFQTHVTDEESKPAPVHAPVVSAPVADAAANAPPVFTNEKHLQDAQDHTVGGSTNQDTEVKTWQNELGPQGLSRPRGHSTMTEYFPVSY